MKRSLVRLLAVVLPLTLPVLSGRSARAGEPAAGLEAAVSQDAFLFAKVADWSKALADLESAAPGRIAGEQAVRDFLAGPLASWDKLAAALEKRGGIKREDVRKAFGGELAVFMPGLARHAKAGKFDPPAFALVLAARVTDAEAAGRVTPALEALLKKSFEADGKASAVLQLGAVKALRLGPEEDDPDQPGLFLFRAGEYQAMAFSNSEALIKAAAEGLAAGRCAAPLSAAPHFRQCRSALGERADLFWFFSVKSLMDQVATLVPENEGEQFRAILDAMKLASMPAVAGAVAVEPPGLRSRTFVAWKPDPKGLASLGDGEPLAPEFLRAVPAGSLLMLAGRFKFDRVIPLFRELGEAVGADFDGDVLAAANGELGFDVDRDLLSKLGSQACLMVLPPKMVGGNPLLGEVNGLMAAVEVRDPAAVRAVVAKVAGLVREHAGDDGEEVNLEDVGAGDGEAPKPPPPGKGDAAKGPVSEFDYKGVKVTTFAVPGGMVSPAVAVTDKLLLITPNVGAMKRLLSGLVGADGAGADALVDSDEFKKAMVAAKLDPAKASGVSYVDSVALAGGLLPKLGMASGLLTTFGGMSSRRAGSASKNNLRQIGLACQMWAEDNDEAFPAGMLELIPDYVADKKLLLCPGCSRHAADGVDYAYVAGLKSSDEGGTVMAYEVAAGADGKVNVLHVDCHVESMKSEELRNRLEAQAAKFKEAGREVKPVEPKGVERVASGAEEEESLEQLFGGLLAVIAKSAAMPPVDAVSKHLFPAVATTSSVEGGILVDGFGPFGFVPHMGSLLGGAGSGGMTAPWLMMMGMRAGAAAPAMVDDVEVEDDGLGADDGVAGDDGDDVDDGDGLEAPPPPRLGPMPPVGG